MKTFEEHIRKCISELLAGEVPFEENTDERYFRINDLKEEKAVLELLARFSEIQWQNESILLFRGHCTMGEEVQTPDLGQCWTWIEKNAFPCGCKHNKDYYYVYFAYIPWQQINWHATIRRAVGMWSWEKEVILSEGLNIEVFQSEKRRKPCQTLLETHHIVFKTVIKKYDYR